MHDEFYPKLRICEQFSRISIPDFSLPEYRNTAHSVLADLELPLYVTTNYDTLMEDALKSRGKKPVSEYCRWNERLENFEELAGLDSVVDKDRKFRPTEEEPLVYHLHGRIDIPHSLVLTEQDYFNFLGFLMRTGPERILPSFLRKGIVYCSFVFLGYSLQDINFLTLHSMFPGRMYPSFIVQLPPNIREERRERAISYLKEYQKLRFGGQLRTYFGTVGDFLLELRTRLGEFKE
jgi:hypothetical protein